MKWDSLAVCEYFTSANPTLHIPAEEGFYTQINMHKLCGDI